VCTTSGSSSSTSWASITPPARGMDPWPGLGSLGEWPKLSTRLPKIAQRRFGLRLARRCWPSTSNAGRPPAQKSAITAVIGVSGQPGVRLLISFASNAARKRGTGLIFTKPIRLTRGTTSLCARSATGRTTACTLRAGRLWARKAGPPRPALAGLGRLPKNDVPSFSKRGRRDVRGGDLPHAPHLAADPPCPGRGRLVRRVVRISPDSGPVSRATSRCCSRYSLPPTCSGNGTTARWSTAGGSAGTRSPEMASPGTCAGGITRTWRASSSPSGTCRSATTSTSARSRAAAERSRTGLDSTGHPRTPADEGGRARTWPT
jgi:hypothetical protein